MYRLFKLADPNIKAELLFEITASEQLAKLGIKPSDIDYVIISHLDCDHANGLRQI
ncbi:MBL fold metallo-hydrolase [Lactobacillus hominis]|uniref:Metallo-beta-lactamase domain-containing protein n=1 Tax=Lactobacillus hominis DSM 23910 = CRBIP 24.179 TaxID=1423758 RepID=I7JUX9_9LACO|nr:MBL fold metallo-hydrolase [Lactobacillus hominis]KRM85614.1 hypothetical protein FC41_GL000927 [Lactobacillus hominis DSM 23910 = CRBIP 24.179]CCI81866.1 Protein of unknown function [Lactobacillus hominis DSM 23910 = CRBIP 24.179]